MYQSSTLRDWVGGMIIYVLMASSAFGQPTAPLPGICHGLEVLQPISPLKNFEIYPIIGTIGLGELRRRIDQGLNHMACAQLMILHETTLERRLPYEQARQQAAEAVQEALSILYSLATPEEKSLLSTLNRAYHVFRPLNAEAASLALLAETPAEVETAKALSADNGTMRDNGDRFIFVVYFRCTHLSGMPLAVKQDKAFNPIYISPFGADAIIFQANDMTSLVQDL